MPSTARSTSASSSTMIAFLPPSSRCTCLRLSAAAFVTATPVVARAGERDDRDAGVPHERIARGLAVAVHDVHDASGHAGLLEQLDEALRQERRVLGRLQHDRVAADERGRELPRRDRDREVPRRDRADDADRHAHRHVELVAQLRRCRLPPHAPALARHVVGHVDGFLDVAAGLGLHLPHLVRHQVGERVLLALEHPREAHTGSRRAAARARAASPERRLRGLDRAVDVFGARLREEADRLAGRRVTALEGLAGYGADPLAADEVLEGLRPRRRHGDESSGRYSSETGTSVLGNVPATRAGGGLASCAAPGSPPSPCPRGARCPHAGRRSP